MKVSNAWFHQATRKPTSPLAMSAVRMERAWHAGVVPMLHLGMRCKPPWHDPHDMHYERHSGRPQAMPARAHKHASWAEFTATLPNSSVHLQSFKGERRVGRNLEGSLHKFETAGSSCTDPHIRVKEYESMRMAEKDVSFSISCLAKVT